MQMMRLLRNLKNHTVDRLFPNWAYEHKKSNWEDSWSDDKFSPNWRVSEIPIEIREIVENNWFQPGATVLDIGCGSGEIAAWLAENSFEVLGIDYSSAAIEIAINQYGESSEQLEFKTVDICQPLAISSKYEALIDRGCLHGIPETFASVFAENVASCAAPGAKFLLLFATNKGTRKREDDEERLRQKGAKFIEQLFKDTFEIENVKPTLFERGSTDPASGIAVKMKRKFS